MGIGGAGVSALARVFLARGDAVSGCDVRPSDTTAALEDDGVSIDIGHDPEHVLGQDLLIFSGAIKDSPELEAARGMGVEVLTRAQMLARLIADSDSIAIAGSHGKTTVTLEPVGVAGLITAWNANALFICLKLASAIAAGCTVVVKPSELSALQTQVLVEALHEAKLPKGLLNVVIGRGEVVGAELVRNPDVDKISFTGSVAVGERIMRDGAATMKRVTLELGGKSPTILLDDA